MEEAALLATLGAALTSPELAESVARFARRHELVELAAAFCEHRKQEEAAAARPAPPVAAWGPSPSAVTADAACRNGQGVPEWKPPAWDPGQAFNAFRQDTPQGSRRGSATRTRGRGGRRSSSRRSAPAVEEPSSDSSGTKLPFDFGGLQIGEEDDKDTAKDSDDVGVAEMDTEADPTRTTDQSTVRRARVVPPGTPPTSGESDSFVPGPAAVPSPGLTAATVPQFNMGAPVPRSSRNKPRRKSRQREGPSQDSSAADVDAPPVVSGNVGEQPEGATADDSSDEASIIVVRQPSLAQPSVCAHPPVILTFGARTLRFGQANRLRAEGNGAYNRSDYLGAVASYR